MLLIKSLIKFFFKEKIFIGDDLDSPESNKKFKEIINENFILKEFYKDCYKIFKKELGEKYLDLKILELGSGSGFIKEHISNVITSEILKFEDIDLVVDATNFNFEEKSIDAIILMNTLHHISDPIKFFNQCNKVLKIGGKILLIEPANTWFSKIIYSNFHHEDFDTNSDWFLKKKGRLSSSNQAMPYIIFERDIKIFQDKFPSLILEKKYKFKPLHYLLSGGFSYRPYVNNIFFLSLIRFFELVFKPLNKTLALFMFIKIVKR